ncbi:MAG: DUF4388 domain-containing protein [Myxococcota bacterium]|nr:DUF4388 domain-containing protein [Myxococcota bacterium]
MIATVPPDLRLDLPTQDAGLVVVGGSDARAVELVRRTREVLEASHADAPIVYAGRGASRNDLHAAGADEVLAQPAYLRDVVTIGRLLVGTPANHRTHLVGNLGEITGVLTLVRALSSLGRSAVLTLIRGLRRGEIRFYEGEVTSAQVGLIHGQAALHQLLLWTDARFDYHHEDIVRRQQIPLDREELFADAERFLGGIRDSSGSLSPAMVLEQDVVRIQLLNKQIPTEVHGVLRMFDGHRVLADVLEDSPYRVFETLRVAQRALDVGLLKIGSTPRRKATWRAVLAIEEWLVGAETKEDVVARGAVDNTIPVAKSGENTGKTKKPSASRRQRKKRRANTPVPVASAPPAIRSSDIDWGSLVPRTVGAEVGPLAGVVPAAQRSGEIVLPNMPSRDEPREKLESLMDTGKRERIFPTDIGLEPSVVLDDSPPASVHDAATAPVDAKKKSKKAAQAEKAKADADARAKAEAERAAAALALAQATKAAADKAAADRAAADKAAADRAAADKVAADRAAADVKAAADKALADAKAAADRAAADKALADAKAAADKTAADKAAADKAAADQAAAEKAAAERAAASTSSSREPNVVVDLGPSDSDRVRDDAQQRVRALVAQHRQESNDSDAVARAGEKRREEDAVHAEAQAEADAARVASDVDARARAETAAREARSSGETNGSNVASGEIRSKRPTSSTDLVRALLKDERTGDARELETASTIVTETPNVTVAVHDRVSVITTEQTARLVATPEATISEVPFLAKQVVPATAPARPASDDAVTRPFVRPGAEPQGIDDEPSDGVIRMRHDTAETPPAPAATYRRPPPGEIPVDDRPPETTGEIRERKEPPPPTRTSEPSILVADLQAAHSAVSAVAVTQATQASTMPNAAAAAGTPGTATAVASAEVAQVRRDATDAFTQIEEEFFRQGTEEHQHAKPARLPSASDSFDDLDEGYEPVGFWDRLLGRKKKK